ncbi:MAG TPA: radical SAM protein [Bacteroidales bacterium]|nr:radical SAM protein [Bacteroidales bacterium]
MSGNSDIINLNSCTLCPRNCLADRYKGGTGYCGMDAGLNVASVCIHRGEEPVIGGNDGICNVFFGGCNLRCIFCQNHEISQSHKGSNPFMNDRESIIRMISEILSTGINSVGFVSPSHMVPQMLQIISGIQAEGFKPVIVYNTNGYDKVDIIKKLEGIVDVYLPDFKYASPEISRLLSGAANYPEIALRAAREMYRQMGSSLITDMNGKAERGLLIRHLVLPGRTDESKKVLDTIAQELSVGVNISLMSQFHPMHQAANYPELGRELYKAEYDEVVEHMQELGFRNGWIQDLESNRNYLPDFSQEHPFED